MWRKSGKETIWDIREENTGTGTEIRGRKDKETFYPVCLTLDRSLRVFGEADAEKAGRKTNLITKVLSIGGWKTQGLPKKSRGVFKGLVSIGALSC